MAPVHSLLVLVVAIGFALGGRAQFWSVPPPQPEDAPEDVIEVVPEFVPYEAPKFSHVDPDLKHVEYRVRLTEWDELIDLSCSMVFSKSPSDISNREYQRLYMSWINGQQFELFQKSHFPFQWIYSDMDSTPQSNPVCGPGEVASLERPLFVCSVQLTHRVIGMVSPQSGKCLIPKMDEIGGINAGTAQDPFEEHDSFQLLANSQNVTYAWAEVADWTQPPAGAVVSYRKPYVGTRFIGALVLPSYGQFIGNMPQKVLANRDAASDQILAVEPSPLAEYLINFQMDPNSAYLRLECQFAGDQFSSELYHKKGGGTIQRTIKGEVEGQNEERITWEVYEKIPKPSLVWVDYNKDWVKPRHLVFAGFDSHLSPMYICRFQRYHRNYYGWIETPIFGSFSLQQGVCEVFLDDDHRDIELTEFQVLTNPERVNLTWSGNFASGHLPNEGSVVGGLSHRDKGAIYVGRFWINGRHIIGQVNPRDAKIWFKKDGKVLSSNSVHYKVLTVE